jgi:hypothetical protein
MTPADTVDSSVCVLIDEWTDGYVSERAWVKVTTLTTTPEEAIARLQREFPIDEQGDGGEHLRYICDGRKERKRPCGLPDETGRVNWDGTIYHWPEVPWRDDPEGEEFWVIEVSDDAA